MELGVRIYTKILPVQFHKIWFKSRQVFTSIYVDPVLSGNPVVSGFTVKCSTRHKDPDNHVKVPRMRFSFSGVKHK